MAVMEQGEWRGEREPTPRDVWEEAYRDLIEEKTIKAIEPHLFTEMFPGDSPTGAHRRFTFDDGKPTPEEWDWHMKDGMPINGPTMAERSAANYAKSKACGSYWPTDEEVEQSGAYGELSEHSEIYIG